MTSLSFQSGVRKANKKIDKLQKKTSKNRSKILERLKDKAVIRYYRSIDLYPYAQKRPFLTIPCGAGGPV